jgi:hypothetical protein
MVLRTGESFRMTHPSRRLLAPLLLLALSFVAAPASGQT